jgi:hypothetical protein
VQQAKESDLIAHAALATPPLPRFLRPEEIETLPELQPRVALLTEVVEQYRDIYRAGSGFPNAGMALPALEIVVTPEGRNLLWDGFHRVAGGRAAGILTFPVNAVAGTFEVALRRSLGANSRHGQPRTQEDKRRGVIKALDYWPELSNRAIADICLVSHTLVNDFRPVGTAGRGGACGIVLAAAPDARVGARAIRGARLVRPTQAPVVEEPPATPPRVLPRERRAGLERMQGALEQFLDCGRDLAELHPDRLILLMLFREIEEAGDKAVLALGGGE